MIRAIFVMEQHIGHRTFYENVRRYVDADPSVEAHWVEVTYREPAGLWERLPLLPERRKGPLRGFQEVRRGLSAVSWDVAFFNTQVPAVFALDRLYRRPYVVSTDITPIQYDALAHLYDHQPDPPGPIRWFKYQVNRAIYHRAARVVAWSNWVRRSLEADYAVPPQHILVVPPGIDLEMWSPSPRPVEDTQKAGPLRILFVGGDFARKGGPILLKAFRTLRQGEGSGVGVELHLVTRDDVAPEPGVYIHQGLTPNSQALRQLYRESDIFVLPTRVEAFGIAAVEASASGLPVIATNVGGLTDIVVDGETGFLVPPDDPDAVAQALQRLLLDPDRRRRMGQAARRRAETHFDARTNGARLVALLKEAVG